jgi:hypothetical protein
MGHPAKASSQIATFRSAVRQGRTLYDNILKFARFQLGIDALGTVGHVGIFERQVFAGTEGLVAAPTADRQCLVDRTAASAAKAALRSMQKGQWSSCDTRICTSDRSAGGSGDALLSSAA